MFASAAPASGWARKSPCPACLVDYPFPPPADTLLDSSSCKTGASLDRKRPRSDPCVAMGAQVVPSLGPSDRLLMAGLKPERLKYTG